MYFRDRKEIRQHVSTYVQNTFSEQELLDELDTAQEVKHRKFVSRGLVAAMGAAACFMFDGVDVEGSRLIIETADNATRLEIAAYSTYFFGLGAAFNRYRAHRIERSASPTYKELVDEARDARHQVADLIQLVLDQKAVDSR